MTAQAMTFKSPSRPPPTAPQRATPREGQGTDPSASPSRPQAVAAALMGNREGWTERPERFERVTFSAGRETRPDRSQHPPKIARLTVPRSVLGSAQVAPVLHSVRGQNADRITHP